MNAEVQKTLGDDYSVDPDDLDEGDWRDLYQRYETLVEIAQHLGISERVVRWRLMSLGIHEPKTHSPWEIVDLLPHEAGLSPLDCGQCGAEEIIDHPCPECGYDPGGEGDA